MAEGILAPGNVMSTLDDIIKNQIQERPNVSMSEPKAISSLTDKTANVPIDSPMPNRAPINTPANTQKSQTQSSTGIHPSVQKLIPKIDTSEQEYKSAWPTVIAIIAAGNGNMGPLFKLVEQKRMTAVFKQLNTFLTPAQQLANSGKWEKH